MLTPLVDGACPTITSQPSSKTACITSTAQFSVSASGDSPRTYQWKQSTDGGLSWNNVVGGSGATSATYTTPSTTTSMNGYRYEVVVTGYSGCQVTSNGAATLTVNTAITTQPSSQTVCETSTAQFSVGASGSSLSYQWQYNSGSGWNNVVGGSGATSATYTTPSTTTSMNGYQYQVLVTKSGCSQGTTSNPATLTVQAKPTITTQPSSQTVCEGSTAAFTVAATGSGLTYQWRQSTNGGTSWSDISGQTSAILTLTSVTTSMNSYQYRVVVTGTCGTVTSNPATLTVNPTTSITTQPLSPTVCQGSTAAFTVAATGSGLTYQWQLSTNGGTSWSDISGQTAATLTLTGVTTSMKSYQYRVVVTGTCGTVTSNAAILTVQVSPSVTIATPDTQLNYSGKCPTLGATVTSGGPGPFSYQWYNSIGAISGATSATYSACTAETYYLRVTNTSSICVSPNSNSIIIKARVAPVCGISGPDSLCDSSTATYIPTLNSILAPSGYVYHWKLGTVVEPDGSSFLLAGTSLSGFYALQLTAQEVSTGSSICNCTKQVLVVPKPVATIIIS